MPPVTKWEEEKPDLKKMRKEKQFGKMKLKVYDQLTVDSQHNQTHNIMTPELLPLSFCDP